MESNLFFFFFSSRRRHTRSLCDWSSDVCSSDLRPPKGSLSVPSSGSSAMAFIVKRSEEHTSELQSHSDLVCRLLLEKKKIQRRLLTAPIKLNHPFWIKDPDFDVEHHVRHRALPSPGDDAKVADLVCEFFF